MLEHLENPKQRAFLAAYTSTGNISQAAEAAGIARETHYRWQREDRAYREAYELAWEMAGGILEDAAFERARGLRIEVFNAKGELTGTRLQYSDRVLIKLLEGHFPTRYGKTTHHAGKVEHQHVHNHVVNWDAFSTAELEQLEQLALKARTAGPRSDPSRTESKDAHTTTEQDRDSVPE